MRITGGPNGFGWITILGVAYISYATGSGWPVLYLVLFCAMMFGLALLLEHLGKGR